MRLSNGFVDALGRVFLTLFLPPGTIDGQGLVWNGTAWVGEARVFSAEPPPLMGATETVPVVGSTKFFPSKSHVVVAIVHADDGTDRAEFRITATLKSDGAGDAAGLDTPLSEVLSATAGAATWTATLAIDTGALVMNGANGNAGTVWTVNAQLSRAA